MNYDYDSSKGVLSLDNTKPVGNQEPGTIIDNAIRQILAYLTDTKVGPDARAVELNNLIKDIVIKPNSVPTGVIVASGLTSAPEGWLPCDGRAIDRTTYSSLFNLIGTNYGSNSSSDFKLPDIRGRVIASKSAGNTTMHYLGWTGGWENDTLTIPTMPKHKHSALEGKGFVVGGTGGMTYGTIVNGGASFVPFGRYAGTYPDGGNKPHNNVQPIMGANFYIKT